MKYRISSIDAARGLVIIFMVLDHVRDLLHTRAIIESPTNLETTTPILFMARWITHLCAPTFVFLAGVSAFLSVQNSENEVDARRFLRNRGLWLIALELTVIGLGIWFDLLFRSLLFQVIYVIGAGLVILSWLSRFPARYLGYAGLAIIFLHDLIPPAPSQIPNAGWFCWSLLFSPGLFPVNGHLSAIVLYPLIPWLGIMLLGYSVGDLFRQSSETRKKALLQYSVAGLGIFILFRTFNLYGDPAHWAPQKDIIFSFLSFINLSKYPPTLLYTAATLSMMFFVLWWMEGKDNMLTRFLSVYGRVPLFFYIVHWYVVHSLMFLMIWIQGVKWEDTLFGPFNFGRPAAGVGVELPYVFFIWIGVVALFYPLCRWYGAYKKAYPERWWLRYI